MLRWIDSEENVKKPSRKEQYDKWVARLSAAELDDIFRHINKLIDRGGEVHTSSYLPGPDWRETPLQVIYERVTRGNKTQAGWCFGLLMMQAIIDRKEQWYCMRPLTQDEEGVMGTVYWMKR